MPGGNKKVTHTQTNLQLNAQRSAAGKNLRMTQKKLHALIQ